MLRDFLINLGLDQIAWPPTTTEATELINRTHPLTVIRILTELNLLSAGKGMK